MTRAVKFTRCLERRATSSHLHSFVYAPPARPSLESNQTDACCSLLDFGHLYLAMLFMAICAMLATFAHHDSAICNSTDKVKAPFCISDNFLCHLGVQVCLGPVGPLACLGLIVSRSLCCLPDCAFVAKITTGKETRQSDRQSTNVGRTNSGRTSEAGSRLASVPLFGQMRLSHRRSLRSSFMNWFLVWPISGMVASSTYPLTLK